jgi:hypothetical protein
MAVKQEDLAFYQVVFSITVQGYAELRNQQSTLSLQERTVLTLIDGVCPVAQYLPFLSSFEPVMQKMQKLETMGLLRRAGRVTLDAVRRFDEQVSKDAQVSHWHSISAERDASGFVALQ